MNDFNIVHKIDTRNIHTFEHTLKMRFRTTHNQGYWKISNLINLADKQANC